MIYLNLRDGSARALDLSDPADAREWRVLRATPSFHRSVRGISLGMNGRRADLPLPRRFRELRFDAEILTDGEGEPVAERVSVQADRVLLSLTMYLNGREGRFRVDLDQRGRPRFVPPDSTLE